MTLDYLMRDDDLAAFYAGYVRRSPFIEETLRKHRLLNTAVESAHP